MDLFAGMPYWPDTVPDRPRYEALQGDADCDVVIVGAGSSGAQTAYQLTKAGLNVVLLDKRQPGTGSTAVNTALLQYAGEKSFVTLKNAFGETAAVRHFKLCSAAIDEMEAVCKELPFNPQFTRRNSLYYASKPEDTAQLQDEYRLLRKHGFDVEWWAADRITARFPFRSAAALYYRNDAEMNPYAYTIGLLELAKERGARVYGDTAVTGRHAHDGGIELRTAQGFTVRALQAVYASGYECLDVKPTPNASMVSSYSVVTEPVGDLSSWHGRSLIWETARPYIYMRTTPDNRIIVGGLDEPITDADERDVKLTRKIALLLEEFRKRFPDIPVKPGHGVAAFYGGTHDGLPMIGRFPELPRCFFLYGYGDNGLVYGQVLSRIIRDLLATGESTDADLYLHTRPLLSRTVPV